MVQPEASGETLSYSHFDSSPVGHRSMASDSDSPFLLPSTLPLERRRGVCALIGFAVLLTTAYFGTIILVAVLLPFTVLAPGVFRSAIDRISRTWLQLAEIIISRLMGIRVRQFGDKFSPGMLSHAVSSAEKTRDQKRSSIVLLNHSTQLDWFFIWGLGDPAHFMRIILKDSLSKVPGAGWAMQAMSFLFLRRRIASDQSRINGCVNYLLKTSRKIQFLMFPEGTNFCAAALASSSRFALKNHLPLLRYTLHPRRTGFTYLVDLLGKDELTDIYDLTVGYPDHFPVPEYNMLLGQVPREVHFHVRRYTSDQLPWSPANPEDSRSQEERFGDWLQQRWMEKEEALRAYYARPIGSRQFEDEVPVETRMFESAGMSTQSLLIIAQWVFITLVLPYTLFWVNLDMISTRLGLLLLHGLFIYFTFWHGSITTWAAQFA